MVSGDTDSRVKTLWLLSNILANSEVEAARVVESGILSNVRIACDDADS